MARTGYEVEHDLTGKDPRAIFVFRGRGETSFGPDLREDVTQLIDTGFRAFEMDLRAVDTCDSVSLGTFVGIQAAVRRVEGTLTFTLRTQTHIRELFGMLNLDRVLTVREVQSPYRTPNPAIRRPPVTGVTSAEADTRRPRRPPETTEELMFEPGLPSEEQRAQRKPADDEA
jgi:anti-anti-sigma regulatory factor